MNETQMWNCEDPIEVVLDDVDVPEWIEGPISPGDIAAICQGGCASGAYMPAVTYHTAVETMSEHGDDVLQYIEDSYGSLTAPRDDVNWSGMAVHYLSVAVELWAHATMAELESVFYCSFKSEIAALITELIGDVHDGCSVEGVDGPAMEATFATNDDATQWSYQTGDNSFTGGAYLLPHWAVVTLTPDSDPDEIVSEIMEQWSDICDY